MIGRKTVIGIAVLCALALSAFASASASAEQRAFTCTAGGAKVFSDEHCITAVPEGTGLRAHVLIKEGEKIEITATNAKTASSTTAAAPAILQGTLAGVVTEINCTGVSGTGFLTNAAASVSGTGFLEYTGCVVAKPAGKKCIVKEDKEPFKEGVIKTNELKATTVGQAANTLKFEPVVAGGNFALIPIEKCEGEAPPKNTYPVTGSVVGTTSGATTTTTTAATTAALSLKFGGNKAGLGGSITISKKGGDPIVLT